MIDKEKSNNFQIEQYKIYWEYIRHVEEMKFEHLKIFLNILTVFVGVLVFLAGNQTSNFVSKNSIFIFVCGLILTIYGVILNLFILNRRLRYSFYSERIKEIEKENTGFSDSEDLKRSRNFPFTSAYHYWYGLLVFLSTLPICFSIWITKIETCNINNLGYMIIAFLLLSLSQIFFSLIAKKKT